MWVVHDILYAKTLVVKGADSSHEIGGNVGINIVPGLSEALKTAGLSAPSVGVSHSRESKKSLDFGAATEAATHPSPASRVPKKVMVGFRLVGFVFNSSGHYVDYYKDPGHVMPTHRAGAGPELSHSDQRAQIRSLYLKPAPEYDSDKNEEEDVIEDEAEDEEEGDGEGDEDDDADDIPNADGATTTLPEDLERWPIVEVDGEVEVLLDEVCTYSKPLCD